MQPLVPLLGGCTDRAGVSSTSCGHLLSISKSRRLTICLAAWVCLCVCTCDGACSCMRIILTHLMRAFHNMECHRPSTCACILWRQKKTKRRKIFPGLHGKMHDKVHRTGGLYPSLSGKLSGIGTRPSVQASGYWHSPVSGPATKIYNMRYNMLMLTFSNLCLQGTLRVLLVLLHDFPEFLCELHFDVCNAIPPSCIQMRNLVLSAFPRNMRLPDPFTPNLKVPPSLPCLHWHKKLLDQLLALCSSASHTILMNSLTYWICHC